jgi:hypothetical protein
MSKKHYTKVFHFWYISMCGRVLNGPILFDQVDSAANRVSAINHKGVIL